MDVTRSQRQQNVNRTTAPEAVSNANRRVTDSVTLGKFDITQSGNVMPTDFGSQKLMKALVPPGMQFDHMEVTALDPAGVHTTARFPIDDDGMLQPNTKNPPLGDLPFRITLVGKNGDRYSADLDISSKKTKVSAPGRYETIEGLKLQKEIPPPPPAPAQIELGTFLLSQSGMLMPEGYGNKSATPILPPGFATSIEVMALDQSHVNRTAHYDVGADGVPVPNTKNPPLGDVPFRVFVTDKDGNRYSGDVDISPARIKVKAPGRYEEIKHLKLRLVTPDDAGGGQGMDGVARDFASKQAQPPAPGSRSLQDLLLNGRK